MRKFSINPVFLILTFWLVWAVGVYSALLYFFAVVLHELGHYLMAKHRGYLLSKFSLSPYGVSLSYYGQTLDEADEILIAFAGPLVNFIVSAICLALWWIFPVLYNYTSQFVVINLCMAGVNLLPAFPLDGGRIFVLLFSKFLSRKVAFRITFIVNILLSITFFTLFVVFCFINFNPTYLLFTVFLVLGLCDIKFISKYEKINIFNKKVKSFSRPKFYVVGADVLLKDILKKIAPNKSCFFIVLKQNGQKVIVSDMAVLNLTFGADVLNPISDYLSQ